MLEVIIPAHFGNGGQQFGQWAPCWGEQCPIQKRRVQAAEGGAKAVAFATFGWP